MYSSLLTFLVSVKIIIDVHFNSTCLSELLLTDLDIFKLFLVFPTEQLLEETEFKGFPVIVDNESQRLAGFVLRRDLNIAISKSHRCK